MMSLPVLGRPIDVRDLGESCVKINGDKTVAKILYAIEDKICNG